MQVVDPRITDPLWLGATPEARNLVLKMLSKDSRNGKHHWQILGICCHANSKREVLGWDRRTGKIGRPPLRFWRSVNLRVLKSKYLQLHREFNNFSSLFICFFSKNRGTPKRIIYNGKLIKMDDLGVPPFSETSIWMSTGLLLPWYPGCLPVAPGQVVYIQKPSVLER